MAYQRQARTFSFSGFDMTRRDVDVVQEQEDHAAIIRPPVDRQETVNGTVGMNHAQFARSGAVKIVSG